MRISAIFLLVLCFATSLAHPQSSSSKVPHNSKRHKQPVAASPSQNPPDTSTSGKHNAVDEHEKPERPITITALPEVSLHRSDWDKAAFFLNIALAVVATGTLVAVWHQANQTKRAAEASEQSTAAVKSSMEMQKIVLRARVGVLGFESSDIENDLRLGREPRFVLELGNNGTIPAHDVIPQTWVEIVDYPFVDFSGNAEHFTGEPITLYAGTSTKFEIPFHRPIDNMELVALREGRRLLCLRLRLDYPDSFGDEARYFDHAWEMKNTKAHDIAKYRYSN